MRSSLTALALLGAIVPGASAQDEVPVQSLSVRVVDREGEPVERALVVVRRAEDYAHRLEHVGLDSIWIRVMEDIPSDLPQSPSHGRTGPDGWVHVDDAPVDVVLIHARSPSNEDALTELFDLVSQPRDEVIVVLDPETPVVARGRVIDLTGAPLPGVSVFWSHSPGARLHSVGGWYDRSPGTMLGFPPVLTDAQGVFELPGCTAITGARGRRQWPSLVMAGAPGHLAAYEGAQGDLSDLTFRLAPAVTIHGRLASPEWLAHGEPRISLWIRSGDWVRRARDSALELHGRNCRSSQVVRDDGSIVIDPYALCLIFTAWEVLPLSLWFEVSFGPDHMAVRHLSISLEPGQDVDLQTLIPRPVGRLQGRVVNRAGEPVSAAPLHWLAPTADPRRADAEAPVDLLNLVYETRFPEGARGPEAPRPRWASITDDDGRFTLSPIPQGQARLWVAGQVVTVDVRPSAEVEITLLD